jgi:aldehyde:ferredoxin oxidoreductase
MDRDEFESALDTYFELCGWDVDTGIPTHSKLDELELGWVADQLGV